LSCHQSAHRKLRTITAKIRSVCIRVNRKIGVWPEWRVAVPTGRA
jgi:hypothetical protein